MSEAPLWWQDPASVKKLKPATEPPHPTLQGHLADTKLPSPLGPPQGPRHKATVGCYRGTSLIRNRPPLGLYSVTKHKALWWS